MTRYRDTPVQPYERVAYCDCGGELRQNGMALMCHPPLWVHSCSRCGEKTNLPEKYPALVYKCEGEE